jgi:hypothetical protein
VGEPHVVIIQEGHELARRRRDADIAHQAGAPDIVGQVDHHDVLYEGIVALVDRGVVDDDDFEVFIRLPLH